MKLALSEVEGYIKYSIYKLLQVYLKKKKTREILSKVLINKHREIIPNCCFPSIGKRQHLFSNLKKERTMAKGVWCVQNTEEKGQYTGESEN